MDKFPESLCTALTLLGEVIRESVGGILEFLNFPKMLNLPTECHSFKLSLGRHISGLGKSVIVLAHGCMLHDTRLCASGKKKNIEG